MERLRSLQAEMLNGELRIRIGFVVRAPSG